MAALERQPRRVDALDVTVRQGRNRSTEDRTEHRKCNEVNADKPRLENARQEMADGYSENEEQNGETQTTCEAAKGDEKGRGRKRTANYKTKPEGSSGRDQSDNRFHHVLSNTLSTCEKSESTLRRHP